jgi:hypothetical protein
MRKASHTFSAIVTLLSITLAVLTTSGCAAQSEITAVGLGIVGPDHVLVNKSNTFTATATVTGGTAPFSYAYTGTFTTTRAAGGGFLVFTNPSVWHGTGSSASEVLSWSEPGTYAITCTVHVTDAHGKAGKITTTSKVTVTLDQGTGGKK